MNKKKKDIHVKVWNIPLVNGKRIKAATIEQGPRTPSPLCENCSAKCCRGGIAPVLTEEEFFSRRFKAVYMEAPAWLKEKVPNVEYLITIGITGEGCPYFDKEKSKCRLWPNPPKSCLAYDCRSDPRPEMQAFAKKREKEYKEEIKRCQEQ